MLGYRFDFFPRIRTEEARQRLPHMDHNEPTDHLQGSSKHKKQGHDKHYGS